MLTLKKHVRFSSYIKPICLIPLESNIAEISEGYEVGFGQNQNEEYENDLKYVKMPIELSNEKCFLTNPEIVKLSSLRTFCAGNRNGSSVCLGDSGSGLFVEHEGVNYLRGIVSASLSFNLKCDANNYAVFTNVQKFYYWITNRINERFLYITQSQVYLIGSRWITASSGNKIFQTINKFTDKSGNDVTVEIQDLLKNTVNNVPKNVTNYNLKMTVKSQNTCKAQSVDILNVESSPIVFVQFNKPIYSSNEAFNFRVFVLTRNLLPVANYGPINVAFRDSDNVEVLRFNTAILTDQFGVFEDEIKIYELLNNRGAKLGIWTLEVTAADRKVIKTFEVQAHNNETEVFVDGPSSVAFVDRKMYLTIHTKDPYDRSAVIHVAAKFINSDLKEIDKIVKEVPLTDIKTVVPLDFQDDLDIKNPEDDMDLSFTVRITGDNSTSVIKNIKMRHKGRNTIQVIRKKYFKPGFKFPIKVRVKDLDGKPDNSLNQLNTNIMYVSGMVDRQTGQPISDTKEVHTNLKNGEAILQLEPKDDTRKIIALFEIANTKHTEEIDRFPGVAEYMQVTMLNKSSTVGSTVQIKVMSSEEMEVLHLMIFGTTGIIHSQQFDDAVGKDLFDFPVKLTDEMRPEARGLVYYARASDGALVYDEFSLTIGFTIDNLLEISAPEQAEPNRSIDITVKTTKDSRVFLIVTDVNSALFDHENEITRPAIYNELVYHLNKKFKLPPNYHFEKLNAFILNPATYGYDCNAPQADDNDPQPYSEIDRTSHKYFPTALTEIVYTASSSEPQTVPITFPDTTTTWKIYGISVHPEKGFTVAKTQPEIAVKEIEKMEKFKLEIRGPTSLIQNEVRDYYIVATNELKTKLNVWVSMTVENGHFVKQVKYGNQNCRQHIESTQEAFKLFFKPQYDSIYKVLQVTSNTTQPIRISAIIRERNAKANATRTIEVQGSVKKLVKKTISNTLVDITSIHPGFEMALVNSDPSKKSFATVYGNILGPAVDGLETILSRNMILDEDKILKLGTEVVIYKFLKNLGLETSPKASTALTNVRNYYNESKLILDSLIQSKSNNIGLVALIADIMNDASTIIDVDFSLIDNSLTFIKNKSLENSIFPYNVDFDNRRDINPQLREFIQAILITKTGLRRKIEQIFFNAALRDFSVNRGDHFNAILAYAHASNGQYKEAITFLYNVNPANIKTGLHQREFSIYVETISYVILTKIILNLDPRLEVIVLLEHRQPEGGFYSPYDTYLALSALSAFSKYRNMRSQALVFYLNQQVHQVYPFESKTINVNGYNQKLAFAHMELGYVNVFYEGTDE
ncbi:CD109 antigen-like isoform X2 [Chironomus tepperi]